MQAFAAFPDIEAWRAERLREGARFAGDDRAVVELLASPTQVLDGHCVVCDASARFHRTRSDAATGSLRESLRCARCGANARQRAAAAVLLDALPTERGASAARVYLTEQSGRFYRALRRRLPSLVGSEYASSRLRRLRLQGWLLRHGLFERLRFADVTSLPGDGKSGGRSGGTFWDGAFDAVVSLDVLEHVPDFRAALREFARVLRPGGRLVLTVPFHADAASTETVARIAGDGRVEHLQPPEYHGDPLGGGVLCFHHFGWDLLDALREAGFADATALRAHDPAQGLPEPLWVLRATR